MPGDKGGHRAERVSGMAGGLAGGVVRGILNPRKLGDATLQGNEKPFVEKARELEKAEKKERTS